MAKGQKRSGREPKKPKQVKKPAAPATTPFGGATSGRSAGARSAGK